METLRSIESLKQIFYDKEDVKYIFDPEYIDVELIEGEQTASFYRMREVYSHPVNVYVTGRTHVGKTSLGNKLYGDKNFMKSTGKVNCTDSLNYFILKSMLRYFDLPGAGANESYENINRAILNIDQLEEDELLERYIVDEFKVRNFTNFSGEGEPSPSTVKASVWNNELNQDKYSPDVCIYMIAPHQTISSDDEKYLIDLLTTFKSKNERNKTIFVLNLFDLNGLPKYTKDNIADCQNLIKNIYSSIYADELAIYNINALTGKGIKSLIDGISNLLPENKLSAFKEELEPELKEVVDKIIAEKFFNILIIICSRIAVRNADEIIGSHSILYESYLSVYLYAIRVFFRKASDEGSVSQQLNNIVKEEIELKKEDIIIDKVETETKVLTKEIDVPIIKKRIVTETYPETVTKERHILFGLIKWTVQHVETKTRFITLDEHIGFKKETINVGTVTEVIGTKKEKIGEKYLKGGVDFISGIMSLGFGMKNLSTFDDKEVSFEKAFITGKSITQPIINELESTLTNIINTTKRSDAEDLIISLLSKKFKSLI